MTTLLAWITICVAIAWATRRSPLRTVSLMIVLWGFIPSVATGVVTGQSDGPLALHPATWLALVTTGVQLLRNGRRMGHVLSRHILLFLCLSTFIVGAIITSRLSHSGGLKLLGDQVVGPVLIFWLIVTFGREDPLKALVIRRILIAVIAAQCALSVIQSQLGEVLFYQSSYLTFPWFNPLTFQRGLGTTDSPLALSLAVCAVAPLLMGVANHWWRFTLLTLSVLGVVSTQSRTGVLVMMLIVLLVVTRSRLTAIARVCYLIALGLASYALLRSPLAEGINSRFSNDTGSSQARGVALSVFTDRWHDFIFTGGGLTSSYTLTDRLGLLSSLESSYLMYAVDLGLVLATIYFGAQILLVIRYSTTINAFPGAVVGALVGCLVQHSFSGTAAANFDGTIIWCLLALVVIGSSVGDHRHTGVQRIQAGTDVQASGAARRSRSTSSAV